MKTTVVADIFIQRSLTGEIQTRVMNRLIPQKLVLTELRNKLATCFYEDTIKSAADLLFSSWFSDIAAIETFDRESASLTSKIINCRHYPNGTVSSVQIRYAIQEKESHQ